MIRRAFLPSWFAVALACACGASAEAQVGSEDPVRFARWVVGDMTAAANGVASARVALAAGGTVGAILLLSYLDEPLTRNTMVLAESTPMRVRRILHETGNVKVVRPMAVALFLGSLTSGSGKFQDAAFTSMQAIVLSNLVTNGLKLGVGRARPSDNVGARKVSPFSGRRSFPSGHATTVFAFTMPWLMYYPRIETYALLGLGVGAAFVRMVDNYHWFTDVLVGAAIGAGTGYLLSMRHRQALPNIRLRPVAQYGGVGIRVSLSIGAGRPV